MPLEIAAREPFEDIVGLEGFEATAETILSGLHQEVEAWLEECF